MRQRKAASKSARSFNERASRRRKTGGRESVGNSGTNTTDKKGTKKRSERTHLKPVLEHPARRRSDIHPLDRAIAELRAELARTPDDPTLLSRVGALYYRRGDLVEAENIYRRAITLAPNRSNLHNNLGNVLCDQGRMRDGIAAYERAMAIDKANNPDRPPTPEAATNLELAKMEFRLIHERIEYLERAAQLDVTSSEALNTLGCGYLLRGDRIRALESFRKAFEMNPRNRFAGLNIAFAHTLNLRATDDFKSSAAEVAEAVIRFPKEGRLHLHQGEVLESAGLLEGAEERYLRAIQADPRCQEAYDLLRRIRQATGVHNTKDVVASSVAAALEKLESEGKAARENNRTPANPWVLYDYALAQVLRARFTCTILRGEEIDALLREAAQLSRASAGGEDATSPMAPQRVAAHAAILRAELLDLDGKRDEARVILEQASAADPQLARLWFARGSLAVRMGDVAEAVKCFDHATLCEPQDTVPYHSLRFAFEGFRRYYTERVRFETLTKANPRDALAHHHMAMAAQSVLRNEESLFHFTRALELDPRLSDAACGRGRVLQRMGHVEQAEAAYVKALDIDPDNAEAHRSLISLRSQKLLAK